VRFSAVDKHMMQGRDLAIQDLIWLPDTVERGVPWLTLSTGRRVRSDPEFLAWHAWRELAADTAVQHAAATPKALQGWVVRRCGATPVIELPLPLAAQLAQLRRAALREFHPTPEGTRPNVLFETLPVPDAIQVTPWYPGQMSAEALLAEKTRAAEDALASARALPSAYFRGGDDRHRWILPTATPQYARGAAAVDARDVTMWPPSPHSEHHEGTTPAVTLPEVHTAEHARLFGLAPCVMPANPCKSEETVRATRVAVRPFLPSAML
jgi:hypothetical protein